MLSKARLVGISLANIFIPISILVFATGFFPYKPFITGFARSQGSHDGAHTTAPFDRVIFMVVDALRSDFVYGTESAFTFTQSLIRDAKALPFTAHATSPTITMPRVKAITTGSIPSFLDVILNFAESDTTSSLANQDTWLHQLKNKPGGNLVMFGDDTWLKLFPDTFLRADGTTSFFVSDFTEVDQNVTRNIGPELDNKDWNGMILHYLGLDHIGHKTGPRGPNMIPKQQEMDDMVKFIYERVVSQKHLQSTLLVLAGDHGMNDAGNHGGSAEGETSPALVFISPKFSRISNGFPCPIHLPDGRLNFYKTVEQSDIAPTLAGLLGFPVPLNNLGVFIPEMLAFWRPNESIDLLKDNAQQILGIVKGTFPSNNFENPNPIRACAGSKSDGDLLECLWSRAINAVDGLEKDQNATKVLDLLYHFCAEAQDIMSSTASNYNVPLLNSGIGLAASSIFLVALTGSLDLFQAKGTGLWIVFAAAAYGAMMFASSYVEEEQHFWYWVTSAWMAWLSFKRQSRSNGHLFGYMILSVASLLSCRTLWRWNQTGQKNAADPDIARKILPMYQPILWLLVLATYTIVLFRLATRILPWASRLLATQIAMFLGLSAIAFKITFTEADAPELLSVVKSIVPVDKINIPLVLQAKVVFIETGLVTLATIGPPLYWRYQSKRPISEIALPLHDLLTLFLITQTRATNIPVFLLFSLLHRILTTLELTPTELSFSCVLLQHASFFALGGSNAISSIDLSNAYNGVSGYNVVAVGILTFLSNWVGPVWWTSATTVTLGKRRADGQQVRHGSGARKEGTPPPSFERHIALLTMFNACSTLCVMLACTLLRQHLFIWTVFSPKYLYTIAWNQGQHICIDVGLGGLMFWIASS